MSTVADNNKTKSDSLGVINISKGEEINLSKEEPKIKKIMFGFGSDCNRYYCDSGINISANIFLDTEDEKTDEELFEFYNSVVSYNNGEGEKDVNKDATINLDNLPEYLYKLAITINISNGDNKQKPGMVDNAYCILIDTENNDKEILHFSIGEEISIDDIIIAAELYRHNGEWKLRVVGQRFEGGIEAFNRDYGFDKK